MAYCIRCGADAEQNQFCPQCGARVDLAVGTETVDSLNITDAPEATLLKPAALPDDTELRPTPPPTTAAPLPTLPMLSQPVPEVRAPKRWTAPRFTVAVTLLMGAVAAGFLATYFLIPTKHTVTEAKANVIPPPLPKPVQGGAAAAAGAPAATTSEGQAYQELAAISARDLPALQSSQLWRAQIASSPANQSATKFLARYKRYLTSQPNLLLAWSGDWPHTWGPSSRNSWVLLSSETKTRTAPILRECAAKPVADRCWAIRLSTVGGNGDNEDSGKPDPGKN